MTASRCARSKNHGEAHMTRERMVDLMGIWRDYAIREPATELKPEDPQSLSVRFNANTSRVILVGEDNPQSNFLNHTLYPRPSGCAGHRLQERILQLPEYVYLALWRANLCTGSWDSHRAGVRATSTVAADAPWSVIVMLGRKVAKIFEPIAGELAPFETRVSGRLTFVSLPHPSGRCREWNDPTSYDRALTVMRTVAPTLWP